jgi:hypothetical protein
MTASPVDHVAIEELQILRQRLREALYAKKARMRELAELCKREQIALRSWIEERRRSALGTLRQDVRRARAAAKARRTELLAEARRSATSHVEVARRALDIERTHAVEQQRISRAHEAERVHIETAHHRAVALDETPSSAMLQRLQPMLDKAGVVRPAPGESRTEALWRYARTHPAEVHALLEPKAERHIAQARERLATIEENVRAGRPTKGLRSKRPEKAMAKVTPGGRSPSRSRSPRKAPSKAAPSLAGTPVTKGPPRSPARPNPRKAPRTRASSVAKAPEPPAAARSAEAAAPPAPSPGAVAPVANGRGSAPTSTGNSATPIPNPYEQKTAARIERQRGKAQRLRAEADAAHGRARALGEAIPMGQPILVGHHSQRRHERDLGKMDRAMRKSVELTAAADSLERRAARAEKHPIISSDDPNAVHKLRAKLADLDRQREKMRKANSVIRVGGGDVAGRLQSLGFTKQQADRLLVRDPLGNVGFPAYALQNASGERARLLARIEDLEKRATRPARSDEHFGDASVSERENRVLISFPCVPAEAIRKELKGAGFRWSPIAGAWQRMTSNAAWTEARRILATNASAASTSTTGT